MAFTVQLSFQTEHSNVKVRSRREPNFYQVKTTKGLGIWIYRHFCADLDTQRGAIYIYIYQIQEGAFELVGNAPS